MLPDMLWLGVSTPGLLPQANAGASSEKNPVKPAAPGARVHALPQLYFSGHYIKPRGLNVENEVMIFWPLFLVSWGLYRAPDKDLILQDITLTTDGLELVSHPQVRS